MNTSTTRSSSTATGTRAERGACAPFAALPHHIASDPRLSPVDVRVILALLYWARSKPDCWPSDRSIGLRVGRSVRTVQRALGRLEALGLVERSPDADNPTGRRITLRHRCHTPTTPAADPPASPMADELRREGERERPEPAAGREGPPPPAGDGGTEPDLATLHQWAGGTDPILRRIAERRLAELGGAGDAIVTEASAPPAIEHSTSASWPTPPVEPTTPGTVADTPQFSPPVAPRRPDVVAGRRSCRPVGIAPPIGESGVPGPHRTAAASRRDRGPRRLLEGPGLMPATLAIWATRRGT